MLRQRQPPYLTFRATQRQTGVPFNPIGKAINGLAEYNMHKRRFLGHVRTKLDNYQYQSETLESRRLWQPPSSRRSTSLVNSSIIDATAVQKTSRKRTRDRLRSLERDFDGEHTSSVVKPAPLLDHDFLEKALQTIIKLRSKDSTDNSRQTMRREVAPYRLLKHQAASEAKRQPLDCNSVPSSKRVSISGKRLIGNKKMQRVSRLDPIEGWRINDHPEDAFL